MLGAIVKIVGTEFDRMNERSRDETLTPMPDELYRYPPLRVARLLFELEPLSHMHLPVEIRGNVLRGSFGTIFQRSVCDPNCPGAARCVRREICAYAMLFEPQWRLEGDRHGVTDAPRGFLFRPTQHPDPNFGPGQPLHFELRLFGQAIEVIPFFLNAFHAMASCGLRGVPTRLISVLSLDWSGSVCAELVAGGKVAHGTPRTLRMIDLALPPAPSGPFGIRFITPTWLRHERRDELVPSLAALLCRVRDRLSFLSQLYELQDWSANFGAIKALARETRTLESCGQWFEDSRRSSRTGQVMPLAGFVGEVLYTGLSPALWPLLMLGQEVHVGRHAVWGNGGYHVM